MEKLGLEENMEEGIESRSFVWKTSYQIVFTHEPIHRYLSIYFSTSAHTHLVGIQPNWNQP